MGVKSSNNQSVKKQNLNLILKSIIQHKQPTRIELAKETNLTKMTITNLINELMQNEIICETKCTADSSIGRKATVLGIHENAPKILGVCIDRELLCVSLVSLNLKVLKSNLFHLAGENLNSLLDKITSSIDELTQNQSRILGIGVSVPGPVDCENTVILNPPNFFGISNFHIGEYLKNKYHLDVFLLKDSNAFILAETLVGKGRKFSNFIYIQVTAGVGSGIVTNNRLLTGRHSNSGEIGHITIDYNGERCYCGNKGCLETYTNTRHIINKINSTLGTKFTNFKDITDYCKEDKRCDNMLYEFFDFLIIGIASAVNILDTEAIILGGQFVYLNDTHILYIENEVNKKKLSGNSYKISVLRSAFTDYEFSLSISAPSIVLWNYLEINE